MKTKIVSCVLIFTFVFFNMYGQWQKQNSGVGAKLYDVSFADSLYGWVLADSSIILLTTNGGNTWNKNNVNFETNGFSKIKFLDRNNGFTLGKKLFSTKDGGKNWSEIKINTNLAISSFFFLNQNVGWVDLVDTSSKMWKVFRLMKTTDSGQTWQTQFTDSTLLLPGFDHSYDDISFLDGNYGVISVPSRFDMYHANKLCQTTDGGNNWKYFIYTAAPPLRFIALSKSVILEEFLRSTDSGNSWISDSTFNKKISLNI